MNRWIQAKVWILLSSGVMTSLENYWSPKVHFPISYSLTESWTLPSINFQLKAYCFNGKTLFRARDMDMDDMERNIEARGWALWCWYCGNFFSEILRLLGGRDPCIGWPGWGRRWLAEFCFHGCRLFPSRFSRLFSNFRRHSLRLTPSLSTTSFAFFLSAW